METLVLVSLGDEGADDTPLSRVLFVEFFEESVLVLAPGFDAADFGLSFFDDLEINVLHFFYYKNKYVEEIKKSRDTSN